MVKNYLPCLFFLILFASCNSLLEDAISPYACAMLCSRNQRILFGIIIIIIIIIVEVKEIFAVVN